MIIQKDINNLDRIKDKMATMPLAYEDAIEFHKRVIERVEKERKETNKSLGIGDISKDGFTGASKNPKKVSNKNLKKMHLSESLFQSVKKNFLNEESVFRAGDLARMGEEEFEAERARQEERQRKKKEEEQSNSKEEQGNDNDVNNEDDDYYDENGKPRYAISHDEYIRNKYGQNHNQNDNQDEHTNDNQEQQNNETNNSNIDHSGERGWKQVDGRWVYDRNLASSQAARDYHIEKDIDKREKERKYENRIYKEHDWNNEYKDFAYDRNGSEDFNEETFDDFLNELGYKDFEKDIIKNRFNQQLKRNQRREEENKAKSEREYFNDKVWNSKDWVAEREKANAEGRDIEFGNDYTEEQKQAIRDKLKAFDEDPIAQDKYREKRQKEEEQKQKEFEDNVNKQIQNAKGAMKKLPGDMNRTLSNLGINLKYANRKRK